nr:MAG TPA: hypothetical protein [Caudoviricetes sp.]
MDTPENMDRCLNCTEPVCNGECGVVSSRSRKKRKIIAQLAEIVYNGGSERFAMEKTGLTKAQIKRYQSSAEYEKEIERLRAKWR